ncbi:hypothetical protein D3C86_1854250 [compost metagenome]
MHAVEPVLGQPGLELAIGLDLFLQRLERFHARRELGLARTFGVHGLLARAAFVVELGHAVLQLLQLGFGDLGGFLRHVELAAQIGEPRFVGHGERIAVGAQAFVARL